MQHPKRAAEIRAVGEGVGLPDEVIEFAGSIYDEALAKGFTPSGKRSYAAAVYAATRLRDHPVKPKEIAAASDGVDKDNVVREMRRIVDVLPYGVSLEDPDEYIDRHVDRLGGGAQLRITAESLADDATDAGLQSGKSPSGFAASCVYAAANLLDADITQTDVADVANVSTVTIRNSYREIIRVGGGVEPRIAPDGGTEAITTAIDDIYESFEHMPEVVHDDAMRLVDEVTGAGWLVNKNPRGVAAGLLYVAASNNRIDLSQQDAADKAGVHKETVMSRVQDVRATVE